MKITQTNDSELAIQSSGISGLIVGAVFAVGGIGIALYPLFATAEWWVSLVGIVVIGIGGALVFTASSSQTVLRRQGTSTITEKRLIGGQTKEASFDSNLVTQVRLESHTEYDTSISNEPGVKSGQQQRQRVSSLFVVLTDGTEIAIGSERVNGNGGFSMNGVGLSSVSKAPLSTEAQQIADFFGVPLNTGIQNASLQDVVGAVQTAFNRPNPASPNVPQPTANPVTPVAVAPIVPMATGQQAYTAPTEPASAIITQPPAYQPAEPASAIEPQVQASTPTPADPPANQNLQQ